MLCAEYRGSNQASDAVLYRHDEITGNVKPFRKPNNSRSYSLLNFLKDVFLPQGYPESVSDDYMSYQIWDTVQAFCSSITGTLATHAVLKGAGVGDETATAASATITWLLKDGIGMVSRIAFAYFKGSSLDHEAKSWRLFADVLNDSAICVQLISPMLPKEYFTAVMCASGVAFSLVGVAGGCTRAALTMHQARRDNMADVSAKDGSQETLVNLLGLIVSLIITPIVSGNLQLTWLLFFMFAFTHIFANYMAVSSVVMETINMGRLQVLLQQFLLSSNVLGPKEANALEPFIKGPRNFYINLGSSLAVAKLETKQFLSEIHSDPNIPCIIKYDPDGVSYVMVRDTASSRDIIRSCGEIMLLRLSGDKYDETKKNNILHSFMEGLDKQGWDLSRHHLCVAEYRWSTNHLDKIKLS